MNNPSGGGNVICDSILILLLMVETTNKAAACVKGSKSVSKRVYKDPRWTLMPNMDLCQFYDSGSNSSFWVFKEFSSFMQLQVYWVSYRCLPLKWNIIIENFRIFFRWCNFKKRLSKSELQVSMYIISSKLLDEKVCRLCKSLKDIERNVTNFAFQLKNVPSWWKSLWAEFVNVALERRL